MCFGCVIREYEEAGLPEPDLHQTAIDVAADPALSRIVADIALMYQIPECGTGGPLHITTDDTNVDDRSLDFCEKEVRGAPLRDGEHQADILTLSEHEKALCLRIIAALRPLPLHIRALACDFGSGAGYDLQYGRGFTTLETKIIAPYADEFPPCPDAVSVLRCWGTPYPRRTNMPSEPFSDAVFTVTDAYQRDDFIEVAPFFGQWILVTHEDATGPPTGVILDDAGVAALIAGLQALPPLTPEEN